MKKFRVATIYNKEEQYGQMKKSFIDAGFTEDVCSYSEFDNTSSNAHEPYNAFNCVLDSSDEEYIILCHQDVLIPLGSSFEFLSGVLENLEKTDCNWVLAGNAGCSEYLKITKVVTDPQGGNIGDEQLPKKVVSLDENFS